MATILVIFGILLTTSYITASSKMSVCPYVVWRSFCHLVCFVDLCMFMPARFSLMCVCAPVCVYSLVFLRTRHVQHCFLIDAKIMDMFCRITS